MVNGQNNPSGFDAQTNIDDLSSSSYGTVRAMRAEHEGIKGSPYLFTAFQRGIVYYQNAKYFQLDSLNFDIFFNDVIASNNKGGQIRLNKDNIANFIIIQNADTLNFKRIKVDGEDFFCEFISLINADKAFYIFHKQKILEANYEGAYNASRPYDKLVDNSRFLVLDLNTNQVTQSTSNKAGFAKLFPNAKKEIKAYSKNNNVDYKSSSSLKKLISSIDLGN